MALSDLLIPPRCLACGMPGVEPFCADCADDLEPDGTLHVLTDRIATVSAMTYGGPLASAIKAVKTGGMLAGADALARLLDLPTTAPITWVPAPARRRRRRGIDLPERLAGPSAVRLLTRIGRPTEQPDVDRRARLTAQDGTFTATTRITGPVVLVDDVRATGATVLAAANALRQAGATRVLCITLAGAGGAPSAGPRRSAARGPPASSTATSGPTWSRPPG